MGDSASRQTVNCCERIREVARIHPENIALIDDSRHITYRELLEIADERAGRLARAGAEPGARIALVAESSALYVATVLAIWKLRAVLVTVYPSSGDADILKALEISDPSLAIVSDEAHAALIEETIPDLPVSGIEDFAATTLKQAVRPNPDDLREPLSLICFSSGTTSDPKAVMLAATTVDNAAETYAELWHLTETDRALISLPMAWLYGLASTTLAVLYRGGTVVIARRGRPEVLVDLARRHRITFIAGVTVTYAKLIRHQPQSEVREAFADLRLSISGGEPRNEAVFDQWYELSGSAVLDAYCASECIPLVTYDPHVDEKPIPGSAGQLVPRQRLKIVDADGDEVPRGEVGEALASGPGLMLGYWGNPELTSEVITPDGWYRMKDLVRMDEKGYIYVVGRLSDVIIRGGTNISPAEIETVLNSHPTVVRAAVVGLPDDIYGQRVVAAVTADDDDVDLEELRTYAAERLSAYKVPGEIVLIPELPVNPTTLKVNRRMLAEDLGAD
ncbi:class I adenylate-forming enzyme family protein [Brevibacterium sp.]|uniref:class I adenylate-forming enzyme family protein n=1 Tax=Brevibacterium sp. TaxID=1701 RepID=UPI002811CC79|nr:class I adenylate-forming enzyme family protein [Brevibacterium sp.]